MDTLWLCNFSMVRLWITPNSIMFFLDDTLLICIYIFVLIHFCSELIDWLIVLALQSDGEGDSSDNLDPDDSASDDGRDNSLKRQVRLF